MASIRRLPFGRIISDINRDHRCCSDSIWARAQACYTEGRRGGRRRSRGSRAKPSASGVCVFSCGSSASFYSGRSPAKPSLCTVPRCSSRTAGLGRLGACWISSSRDSFLVFASQWRRVRAARVVADGAHGCSCPGRGCVWSTPQLLSSSASGEFLQRFDLESTLQPMLYFSESVDALSVQAFPC